MQSLRHPLSFAARFGQKLRFARQAGFLCSKICSAMNFYLRNRMYIFYIAIGLFFSTLFNPMEAQPLFSKVIGPAGNYGRSVLQTSDQGFIFCGFASNATGLQYKILVVRTDSLGQEIWRKNFAMDETNYTYSIVQTQDGGFAIGGYSQPYNSNYQQDMFILRIAANGDSLWAKSYGQPSTSSEMAYHLLATSDNGFLLSGKAAPAVLEYMRLVKLDANGTVQWQSGPMSNFYQDHRALISTEIPTGGYLVGGTTSTPVPGLSIVRIDSAGNTIWGKRYRRGSFIPSPAGLACLPDSGFLVAANVPLVANGSQSNTWILRLKPNGDTLWTKTFLNARPRSLVKDGEGNFWIAGNRPDQGNFKRSFLMKINLNGDSLWCKEFSNFPLGVQVDDAKLTQQGGLVFVGNCIDNNEGKTALFTSDPLGNTTPFVSVNDLQADLGRVELYPNPAGETLWLRTEKSMPAEVSVLNSLGQVYQTLTTDGQLETQIPLRGLASGSYLLQIRTEKGTAVLRFQK